MSKTAKTNGRREPRGGGGPFPIRRIPLADIIVDLEVQGRDILIRARQDAVEQEYHKAMLAGAVFPPVVVFEGADGIVLADGFTRYAATEEVDGRPGIATDIDCIVHPGTKRDAILFAAGANTTHGQQRTTDDKRKVVDRLLRDEEWGQWSDNEIASRCMVSQPFVSDRRAKLVASNVISEPAARKVRTKYGKSAKMKVGKIGKGRSAAPTPAPAVNVEQPKRAETETASPGATVALEPTTAGPRAAYPDLPVGLDRRAEHTGTAIATAPGPEPAPDDDAMCDPLDALDEPHRETTSGRDMEKYLFAERIVAVVKEALTPLSPKEIRSRRRCTDGAPVILTPSEVNDVVAAIAARIARFAEENPNYGVEDDEAA